MLDGDDDEALAWIALATALSGLRAELRRRQLDPVVPLAVVGAMGALEAVLLNLGQGPAIGVPRVGAAELLADARSALTLLIDNDEAWELPIDRLLHPRADGPGALSGRTGPAPRCRVSALNSLTVGGIADTTVCRDPDPSLDAD